MSTFLCLVLSVILWVCVCGQPTCPSTESDIVEASILYGPSQVAKSTMVCQLLEPENGPCPEVGDGTGESVTATATLYHTNLGLLVDGPGIDDSKLRFTMEEAGRRIAVAVGGANVTRAKFVVMESLRSDSVRLRSTLSSLIASFGRRALEATVVVASKANLVERSILDKRVESMQKVLKDQGLKELVIWQGEEQDEAGKAAQLSALQGALCRVQAVPTKDLEDLWQRQRRRAQELHDKQPTQFKSIEVEVEEEYQVNYTEKEPYEESYIEQEPYIETYTSVESCMKTKTVMVEQCTAKWRGWIGKAITGSKKTVCENVPQTVSVESTCPTTATRKAFRSITKYATKYRDVTRYRTAKRMKTVSKVVEYYLPVSHFYQQALDEILEEIRSTLKEEL